MNAADILGCGCNTNPHLPLMWLARGRGTKLLEIRCSCCRCIAHSQSRSQRNVNSTSHRFLLTAVAYPLKLPSTNKQPSSLTLTMGGISPHTPKKTKKTRFFPPVMRMPVVFSLSHPVPRSVPSEQPRLAREITMAADDVVVCTLVDECWQFVL